jgi:hypothetical protein
MSETDAESLPRLYQRWAAELLDGPIPRETVATCDRCAMARPDVGNADASVYFDPGVKCCSYHPRLPNFLVGALLSDGDPAAAEGRRRIEARITDGAGVTPLSIAATDTYLARYRANRSAFGRDRSLLCPYFVDENGGCNIYSFRNAVCATWFCKFRRGALGQRFWQALRALLREVESGLSWWCAVELDPGPEALALLRALADGSATVGDGDRAGDPATWRARWGRWEGRESDFFRAAAALVAPLSFTEAIDRAAAASDAAAALSPVRDAWRELSSENLPEALRPGPLRLVLLDTRRARVVGRNPHDPLDLPRALLDLLPRFDGRPTAEVLAALAADGIRLSPALLRRLVDFGLLTPAD